ncbi:hypothetical protein EGW08_017627 [Elysia chlorotica]|uniref:RRM domain-containing protein n=1 Tax=Elysia chlorotica TaxID=188477 RepID=A0A3S1AX94_ELYCH|nr:hypothetical protein EGW08_017627 [Elysia chlorotica]
MSQGTVRGNKRKAPPSTSDTDDITTKTEAELHLQRLLEKQMKTDVTLSGHFSEHRSFSEATKHRPGVDELIGVHGYQEYKLASDLDAKIDFLRHCGLNDEEIATKLKQDMGIKAQTVTVGYGPEPGSQANKLQEIEAKIKEKEKQLQMPTATKGALLLSRQRMELEASHSQRFGSNAHPSATSSALLIKGIQVEPTDSHPDDPINHIPAMLGELEGKTTGQREPRRDRRRRRKLEKKMEYYKQFEEDAVKAEHEGLTSSVTADAEADSEDNSADDSVISRLSAGDVEGGVTRHSQQPSQTTANNTEEIEQDLDPSTDNGEEELGEATCAPRPADWVPPPAEKRKRKRPKPPGAEEVELKSDVTFLTRADLAWTKCCIKEIRMMRRFADYTPGEPNKVLYVKNLPRRTKMEDLMAMFGGFQPEGQPRMTFRHLKTRGNGQAFVHMPDEATASEALKHVNGYILHGGVVIVTYGKKTPSDELPTHPSPEPLSIVP